MSKRKRFVIGITLPLLLCVALGSPAVAQRHSASPEVYETTIVPNTYNVPTLSTNSSIDPEVYETIVVPKTYDAPTLYLYQSTWLIEDTIHVNELTISKPAVLKAPEGKYLTLSVNGIGKQIQPGTYIGDVVLSVTDNCFLDTAIFGNQHARNFHTAVLVEDGKVVPEKSTPALVLGGEVTDTKAEGIYIGSEEESFNGIIIAGDTEYTINNANIDLEGYGDGEFIGVGSAVSIYDNAKVTINDSEFNVNGVTRCAISFGDNSVTTLNNCKIYKYAPNSDWVSRMFVWQIGFRGEGRAALHAGTSTVYYNNCLLKGTGVWGLCSLDNQVAIKIYLKDSTLELDGPTTRGYGVFDIGKDNDITFDHCTVDLNGYPLFMSSKQVRAKIINGCLFKSRLFGVYASGDDNGIVDIKDATFQTEKSSLLIKGSSTTFNIDNTVMEPKNGVIVQLHDDEECGMDQVGYNIPVGVVDVAVPGRDLTTASPTEDVHINIANSKIQGDFFNSTTNIHAEKNAIHGGMGSYLDSLGFSASQEQKEALGMGRGGAAPEGAASEGGEDMEMMMAGIAKDLHGPKNLGLNLTNASVEGVVSSATQSYREGLTFIGPENREDQSNITQTAAPTVNNGVIVSLDKKSEWIVTGTSYITALSIAKGAEVKAPKGKNLTMLVNGEKTKIKAGTYTGKIQMVVN